MEKVALFVDGANMFYAQRENKWHIDYRKILEYFTLNTTLHAAYYFTATPPASQPERVAAYRRFRAALINMGYSVIDKEVTVITHTDTGQVKLKGNLDIEMVFRMMAEIALYDHAILIGTDVDYVPIIKHLRDLGKRITVVGRKEMTSLEIKNSANKFIDLNEIKKNVEKQRT